MVECVVCLNLLKPPVKILQCGHSFCLTCLRRLVSHFGSTFKCPICRKDFALPDGRVENVTTNFAANCLLEELRWMREDEFGEYKESKYLDQESDEQVEGIAVDIITSLLETSNAAHQNTIVDFDVDSPSSQYMHIGRRSLPYSTILSEVGTNVFVIEGPEWFVGNRSNHLDQTSQRYVQTRVADLGLRTIYNSTISSQSDATSNSTDATTTNNDDNTQIELSVSTASEDVALYSVSGFEETDVRTVYTMTLRAQQPRAIISSSINSQLSRVVPVNDTSENIRLESLGSLVDQALVDDWYCSTDWCLAINFEHHNFCRICSSPRVDFQRIQCQNVVEEEEEDNSEFQSGRRLNENRRRLRNDISSTEHSLWALHM